MDRRAVKLITSLAGILGGALAFTGAAQAYEYPLIYTPPGNFEGLLLAGYQISGTSIIGNCSYTQITSGSGRDPKTTYTPIPQTCTWSYSGALVGIAPGAPTIPAPIGTQGSETIYARKGSQFYTGSDTALSQGGFVYLYGSHENWLTSNAYQVLPQQPYTFTVVAQSNGDTPLNIKSVRVTNTLAQTKATINSNTCVGAIPVGATCAVTVTYTDNAISSPSGLAYDTLTVHLDSDAKQTNDFVQSYTLEVRVSVDGGGG